VGTDRRQAIDQCGSGRRRNVAAGDADEEGEQIERVQDEAGDRSDRDV
jgi:hypothetical protein